MKVADRYIAGLLIKYFAAGMLGVLSFYTLIEFLERFGRFKFEDGTFDYARAFAYHVYSLPSIFWLLAPLVFCLCCMMILSRLQVNSQVVAFMAGGVSLFRIQRTFFVCSLALGLSMSLMGEMLTPYCTEKKLLAMNPLLFSNNPQTRHLRFSDRISFPQDFFPHLFVFKRNVDLIDIENVNLTTGEATSFHATLFDEKLVPKVKIFSKKCFQTGKNTMTLRDGYAYPYHFESMNNDPLRHFDEVKFENIASLKTVALAKIDPKSLRFSEIRNFTTDAQSLSELASRLLEPVGVLLMAMCCFSVAIPLMGYSPVYSYVSCTVMGFFYFSMLTYLKGQIENGIAQPYHVLMVMTICSVIIYFLGSRHYKT
ncbi:MAG: LptF/LptG family permease [Planctomycetes bacterium]|nr:LptF/LptG family permease [Planctomycetota bacterium]